MREMKHLLLLLVFLTFYVNRTWSQSTDEPVIHTVEYLESIYKSPPHVISISNVALRFTNSASAYLKWEKVEEALHYVVEYKPNDFSDKWEVLQSNQEELLIENLPLDVEYVWKVQAVLGSDQAIHSGRLSFSTFPQGEPVQLSGPFFDRLSAWFRKGENQVPFCEFLADLDLHLYEKLAFLQVYSFDNAPLVKSKGSKRMTDWYPQKYIGEDCLGFEAEKDLKLNCNCKVLSRGSNFSSPNEVTIDTPEEQVIKPTIDQYIAYGAGDKTYVDLFQAGAAKYVALRQDENSGGMSYALSNLQGADNSQTVTAASSELKFFLGCVGPEGLTTNLPKECDCERPLDVQYQYTTKLYVKAEKKNCPWSKGAAAQAEDMALVVAFNEGTGNLQVLDVGHAILSRRCNSSWNPDFWINLLDVVKPALEFYVDTQTAPDSMPSFPTDTQIEEFIDALQVLIGTPFSNREGFCETLPDDEVLVSGTNQLTLYPNQLMRISLFSSYYVRTRGFGCYRAEASIASDYFLAGVVESKGERLDDECCSDKFANYILGSLSTPENGDVQNDAVNSLANRMSSVAFFLSGYGDWQGLEVSPNTGLPNVKGEFGLLKGPSCDVVQDDKRYYGGSIATGSNRITGLYPSVSSDKIVVQFENILLNTPKLRVYNTLGLLVYQLSKTDRLDDSGKIEIDVSRFSPGSYWVQIDVGGKLETLSFIKL